jgi:hypothetical protein
VRRILSDTGNIGPHDVELFLEGIMAGIKVMRREAYDSNDNGVVDKASGIPVLSQIPSDLSSYSDGDMFKVGTRLYIVDKPA